VINIIKLTNGTELLGRILVNNDKEIKINNPLQINYFTTKGNQTMPSVALQRYMPFAAEEDVIFKREHVMNISIPVKGMDEYYSKTLNNIKINIDTSIVADLADASESMAEGAEVERDMYLAILERMAHKSPLN